MIAESKQRAVDVVVINERETDIDSVVPEFRDVLLAGPISLEKDDATRGKLHELVRNESPVVLKRDQPPSFRLLLAEVASIRRPCVGDASNEPLLRLMDMAQRHVGGADVEEIARRELDSGADERLPRRHLGASDEYVGDQYRDHALTSEACRLRLEAGQENLSRVDGELARLLGVYSCVQAGDELRFVEPGQS